MLQPAVKVLRIVVGKLSQFMVDVMVLLHLMNSSRGFHFKSRRNCLLLIYYGAFLALLLHMLAFKEGKEKK